MVAKGALVPPIADAGLEAALRAKLALRGGAAGSLGGLEPLAVRLGLIQRSVSPRLHSPRLVVFAADHGLAVEDIDDAGCGPTAPMVRALLGGHVLLTALAGLHGLDLVVVDSGIAEELDRHPRLLARKIAHGTRNARLGAAMSVEQALAAMRAGMEIGEALGGDAVACAGLGQGSEQSAALLLSCLSGTPLRQLSDDSPRTPENRLERRLRVLHEARGRHSHLDDPVEVLAATGGFEIAMMAGLILVAASRQRLVVADGLAAYAALAVAAAVAPATTDYCVHARSHPHRGLDSTLAASGAPVLPDAGLDAIDGTGAAFAWPLARCAAALLGDAVDDAPSRAGDSRHGVSALRRAPREKHHD